MTQTAEKTTVHIDAKGKAPGRVATQIVRVLLGKDAASWAPNKIAHRQVVVVNARHVRLTPVKMRTKVYRRHSGYPGGLKEIPLAKMAQQKPEEVIRHAVHGMLPKNKLRARALKNLRIYADGAEDSQQ